MRNLVMIIGGGILQVAAIEAAKKLGFSTLVIDQDLNAPGCRLADYTEAVSTKDIQGALRCARAFNRRYGIAGVFTAGTDVSYTVATIAHELKLPGIDPQSALNATDKFRMRKCLKAASVPCPEFGCAYTLEEALARAAAIGYPVVIKPVDSMGARGVRRIDSPDELCGQFSETLTHSGRYSTPAIIVEEYMHGPEVSIDTLVDDEGNIHILTIADRHIAMSPFFVEWGHSVPSLLSQAEQEDVIAVMKKAIRAVGITLGAAKADIKVTPQGAKIGEITARLSGGFHSQYTDPLATGMQSTTAALKLATGLAFSASDVTPRYERVAIERALIPKPGRICMIKGIAQAKQVPGVFDVIMTKEVGDIIEPLTSNIGKAGHIICSGQTRQDAEQSYYEAKSYITIETVEEQQQVVV